ncbi:MAG TPA: TetR/AcrR family transcriptional regulator [Ignavibacteriaceae bacterium]|nr:TetR/AcrR family transcriptional regulator [Ignavibacteriaceae bacterium]
MKEINVKDSLLNSAYSLFLGKGYHATTVDEICKKSGVSKGSFFYYFKSKEELGLEVLKWYYAYAANLIMSGSFVNETNPLDRVFGLIDHTENISKQLWGNGCLLGSFVTDLTGTNERISAKVSNIFNEMTEGLAKIFIVISEKNKSVTARELAEQYLLIIEGGIILAKAKNDWEKVVRAIQNFRNYLKLLIR